MEGAIINPGDVPILELKDAKRYYKFILKYYALMLGRKSPTEKESEFMLGVIWANNNKIAVNTKNRLFTEYYINRGWQHPNINSYRDRLMYDKWLKISPDKEEFNFAPEILIPALPPTNAWLPIHFAVKVKDTTMYTQFPNPEEVK